MSARLLIVVVFSLFSISLVSGAGTYYFTVDNVNGVDSSNCVPAQGSVSSPPCSTISYALNAIPYNADKATINITQTGNFYTGGSNKKLTVTGKAVYIVGGDPINRVVMDCEESGFGFSVTSQVQVFSLSNVEMRNCVGLGGGGALTFNRNGKVNVDNCIFTNNSASEQGGAIFGQQSSQVKVVNSRFYKNTAAISGGAIALQNTQLLDLQKSLFNKNFASKAGGGIYLFNQNILLVDGASFTDNLAQNAGGAIYSDPETDTPTTIVITNSTILHNNCVTGGYNDSYVAQFVCIRSCTAPHIYNISGCTDLYKPTFKFESGNNRNTVIVVAIVIPFVVLGLISAAVYFYFRKEHNAEMKRREEYRGMIIRALSFMGPGDDEDYPAIDPDADMCALCQVRPITAPLTCGDRIVCSICRTILLECPVCKSALKDRSTTTTQQPSNDRCRVCYAKPATVALPCGDKVVCPSCRMLILECPVCKTSTRERTQTI